MDLGKDRLPTTTKHTAAQVQSARQASDAENQGDSLESRTREALIEQAALLEASPLELQYSAALALQVQAKHDQVDRIEDRLETLIEQQSSRLQQVQNRQPGLLTLPGARAKWQRQIQQQRTLMQRLEGRLESVREIRDAMSIHGPRIEELAGRKVRAQAPELAADFDDFQEAQRRHQAKLRQQEKEKRQAQELGLGKGLSLVLSQRRG